MRDRLDEYRSNETSQFGEDGLLAYLVEAYPGLPHICLEVGAGDGVTLSNTHRLWAEQGWKALLIEQDARALTHRFGHLPNVTVVAQRIAAAGPDSLDAIARRSGFPPEIGIASIDIDSFDYWVLAHLDYLRPAIVVIEFNPRIPADIDYCDPEGSVFLRHSAAAVARLARAKGYRVVACSGPNAILVSEATIAANPGAVPDLPIDALFDHDYAKKFSKGMVSAQFVTDLPIYTRRPTLLMRGRGLARYAWLTLRDRWNGRPPKVHRITHEVRAEIERSGLWV
jgi:hypothetical protein